MRVPLEPLFKPKKILEKLDNMQTPSNFDCIRLMHEKEILQKENSNLESELKILKQKNESLKTDYDIIYSEYKLGIALQNQTKNEFEKQSSLQIQEISELKQKLPCFDMIDSQCLMDIIPEDPFFNQENKDETIIETLKRKLVLLEEDYKLDVDELKRRIQEYIQERDDYKAKLDIQSITVKQLALEHQTMAESVDGRRSAEGQIYFEEIKAAFQQQKLELSNKNQLLAELECMQKRVRVLQTALNEEIMDNHLLHKKYSEERKKHKQCEKELSETNFLKRDYELRYIKSEESRQSLRDKLRSLAEQNDLKNNELYDLKRETRSLKEQLRKLKEAEKMR